MIYLLYLNEEIIHGYGNLEVLRLNLLILVSQMLFTNKINKIAYKNLEKYLTEVHFSFDNVELKEELVDLGFKVEIVDYDKDAKSVLEKIKKGVSERLDHLEEILSKDVRITATFPGDNPLKHRLGTMYIDDWKLVDEKNYKELAEDLYRHITERLMDLKDIYDDRIKFGDVLYQNASSLSYQVWSANQVNYDLKEGTKIPGDYQALEMKMQVPGVFGLVVTPRYGY